MCAMIPMFLVRSRAAFAVDAFDAAAYWRQEWERVLREGTCRLREACCLHSHRVNMPVLEEMEMDAADEEPRPID
jgi:hypothetical protein